MNEASNETNFEVNLGLSQTDIKSCRDGGSRSSIAIKLKIRDKLQIVDEVQENSLNPNDDDLCEVLEVENNDDIESDMTEKKSEIVESKQKPHWLIQIGKQSKWKMDFILKFIRYLKDVKEE